MTTTEQITETTGQALRRYFSIGTRTRRYRDGRDLHESIFEAIHIAATMPGAYTERTEGPLREAFSVALSWNKHVEGHRLPGEMVYALKSLSPYQITVLIDRMVRDGVSNVGQGEHWFADHRAEYTL